MVRAWTGLAADRASVNRDGSPTERSRFPKSRRQRRWYDTHSRQCHLCQGWRNWQILQYPLRSE